MTDTNTPEQEVNTAPEITENTDQVADAVAEPTVADLHVEEPAVETKKKVDSVPLARLNKEIQRRKELEAELKELRGDLEADPEVEDVEDEPAVKKLEERLESIEKKDCFAIDAFDHCLYDITTFEIDFRIRMIRTSFFYYIIM